MLTMPSSAGVGGPTSRGPVLPVEVPVGEGEEQAGGGR